MSLLCFLLSAVALGHALQINDGFYTPIGLVWVTLALGSCAAGAVLLARPKGLERSLPVHLLIAAGIGWQLQQLFVAQPGFTPAPISDVTPVKIGSVAMAILLAGGVARVRRLERVWFPAALAIAFALGVWMIRVSPDPTIDVVAVHRAAINALLAHKDPYRVWFPNVYGELAAIYYNPSVVSGNFVLIGYPYPPVSLLFAVPGQVIAGDYRYAELAAMIAGAALIGFSGRGLLPRLAACVFLTTPRGLFILQQGWTEPIAVMLLGATVFFLIRRPAFVAWAAGLLIVSKQYLGLAGPAYLRLVLGQPRRMWAARLGIATFIAAAATLPLALWHPNSFMNNVVWLQTKEPFRLDSLSYLSWAAQAGWGHGTFLWAVGAALVALAAALAITPNTAAGFAGSIALASLAMFAFGSKAFANYYYFVIGALCCTAAACAAALDSRPPPPR